MSANPLRVHPTSPEIRQGVMLWIRKQAFFLVLLALVLFLSAGTLRWPEGWVCLGLSAAIIVLDAAVLIPTSPDLLAERSEKREGTKPWDEWLVILAVLVFPLLTWLTAGLDERFGWSGSIPAAVWIIAVLLFLGGALLTLWAMAANRFFSATVRIQTERGQTVVSGGPYRFVRHPGYTGAIIYQVAVPLVLGSWVAMVPSALAVACHILRTALEDRALRSELEGYQDYTQRVRYHLLQGVW